MHSVTYLGSRYWLKNLCAMLAFRLAVKMRVALNMAAADHRSGFVWKNHI